MKISYLGKVYECVSVEKKLNEIIIHTGKVEDGEEAVYQICGDIDFSAVELDGGTWTEETTDAERIAELESALEMLLSGVTE